MGAGFWSYLIPALSAFFLLWRLLVHRVQRDAVVKRTVVKVERYVTDEMHLALEEYVAAGRRRAREWTIPKRLLKAEQGSLGSSPRLGMTLTASFFHLLPHRSRPTRLAREPYFH